MGYDLLAYFDVDQDAIEKFIQENNIDKNDWKDWRSHELICKYYQQNYMDKNEKLNLMYSWNKACQIHEIHVSYRTTFIRDDERFTNRRYHAVLEKKFGRRFQNCLRNINWSIHTSADALEVADGLSVFFADDEMLMYFAGWLRITAKYRSTYELSY
jgi:hypothetical protein